MQKMKSPPPLQANPLDTLCSSLPMVASPRLVASPYPLPFTRHGGSLRVMAPAETATTGRHVLLLASIERMKRLDERTNRPTTHCGRDESKDGPAWRGCHMCASAVA